MDFGPTWPRNPKPWHWYSVMFLSTARANSRYGNLRAGIRALALRFEEKVRNMPEKSALGISAPKQQICNERWLSIADSGRLRMG